MYGINEIGGYFELELQAGQEYHTQAMRFNSGRNALCFYLIKNKIRDLFVPYFIPESLLENLKKIKTDFHFYNIDENFRPLLKASNVKSAHVLYVNYFGICENHIKEAVERYSNVVADYSQAFFSNPEPGIPTFYSPRKFFGVADGGYLYAPGLDNSTLTRDKSAQRYISRLVRLDSGYESGNFIYHNTEELIGREKIRQMSALTQKILSSFRYDQVWEKRENNFRYIHNKLAAYNLLQIDLHNIHGPMVYPFLSENENIVNVLYDKKIFATQFWPEVLRRTKEGSFEYRLSSSLAGLPIDQRYGFREMDVIVDAVKQVADKPRTLVQVSNLDESEN
ncbi:MAG: hypothetical protein H6627_11960 [Calditrichae bacterium]|nr:hypothetical protein [Calditrichota bacterium]MCB9059275.1 hypothetical protein [Calditrichia bacterium]